MRDNAWRLSLHLVIAVAAIAIVAKLALAPSGQEDLRTIEAFVNDGAGSILKYAVVVAAVGTVSMALIELIKALGDLQRWFHEWRLREWVTDKGAFDELVYLAIGDRSRVDALCGEPIEKMMGQIQAAANVALDFPDRYPHLYRFLTTTDVERPEYMRPGMDAIAEHAKGDREFWMSYATVARTRQPPPAAGTTAGMGASAPPDDEQLKAAKTRIRLANLVSRKLDAFQLRTQYFWDRSNQLAAVIASVAVMYYALLLGTTTGIVTLHSLLLGLLSGAIAPFAKDLTKGLAQFAKP